MPPGQPWGSIIKPTGRFFGHQRVSIDEVEQISERLYSTKIGSSKESHKRVKEQPRLNKSQIDALLKRLANKEETLPRTPDRNRTGPYKKEWGVILNSYPWTGQNHQAILCGEESP